MTDDPAILRMIDKMPRFMFPEIDRIEDWSDLLYQTQVEIDAAEGGSVDPPWSVSQFARARRYEQDVRAAIAKRVKNPGGMTVRYRNCREVEKEHRTNGRQYAHTFHYEGVVCLCEAFWDLPRPYRDGILLHEIGHLLVGPEGSEREATEAAEELFGVDIRYVDSEYGDALERLM